MLNRMPDPSLVEFSSEVLRAMTPHILICGGKGAWAPRVRGNDPADGKEISLAWYYRDDYETKAEAIAVARFLLREVRRHRRLAAECHDYDLHGNPA